VCVERRLFERGCAEHLEHSDDQWRNNFYDYGRYNFDADERYNFYDDGRNDFYDDGCD